MNECTVAQFFDSLCTSRKLTRS